MTANLPQTSSKLEGPLVKQFSLTQPRNPTKEIVGKFTRLGFAGLWLHDLRGIYETLLLDAGVPVHLVATRGGRQARMSLLIV